METFIKIPEFTSAYRVAIFRLIRDLAHERGLASMVELAERGLLHDRATHELDRRWARRSRGRLYKPAVTDSARRVQPVLLSIRDLARAHTRGLPEADPLHEQVQDMLRDIYPGGVGKLVTQPHHERVAAVEIVLGKLQTTHAPLVQSLGMTRQVARLAELTLAYREAVTSGAPLQFAEVQAMRTQGQQLLRALIALILGSFYDDRDPDQVATRQELLEPIERMTKRAARTRRRRRRPKADEQQQQSAQDTDPDADIDADPDPDADTDTDADPDADAAPDADAPPVWHSEGLATVDVNASPQPPKPAMPQSTTTVALATSGANAPPRSEPTSGAGRAGEPAPRASRASHPDPKARGERSGQ